MGNFNLMNLACIMPKLLDAESCEKLIRYYEKNSAGKFTEHSTHSGKSALVEASYTAVLVADGVEEDVICREAFDRARYKWCKHLEKHGMFDVTELHKVTSTVLRYRILKYEIGAFLHPHTDIGTDGYARHIRASCSINLTPMEDYEGGLFGFHNLKEVRKLDAGECLIFPADSFWTHEVTPVSSGVRYSVNAFLGTDPSD